MITNGLIEYPYGLPHPILGANRLTQRSGSFAHCLIPDRHTHRLGQSAGSQTFARDRGWTRANASTRRAQKGWSFETGMIMLGTPARSPAPVVPAPP